jgi:hypothetical protein
MTFLRSIKSYKPQDSKQFYCQCQLKKIEGNYTRYQIAYIPKELAIKNNVIKIKVDGSWNDGWTVTDVWIEVNASFLGEMRNAIKHHADVSDI